MASNGNNLLKDADKYAGLSPNSAALAQAASTAFPERETGAFVKGSLRIRVLQATDVPTETNNHPVSSPWMKNPLRKQHSGKTKHEVKLNAVCIVGCTSEGPVFATESMALTDNIFWNEEFAVDNVTTSDELKLYVIDRGKNEPYSSLSLKDDITSGHGFIGKVSLPLMRLPEGEEIEQWYPLVPKESYLSLRTALRVMLCFVPQGDSRLDSKMARSRIRTQSSLDTTGRLRNSFTSPTNVLQVPNPHSIHLPTGIIEYVIVVGSQSAASGNGETNINGNGYPENTILFRYPETDRPDFPLPTKIEWFCFPGGPEIIQQEKRPQSRIFSFVLCGGQDGLCRSYGVCLVIYHQENSEKESEQGVDSPTTTWISSCVCMISRLPLIDQITGCLVSVAYSWLVAAAGPASNLNPNHSINKPKDYIIQLCHGIPLPIRGIMGVEVEIAKLPISLVLPNIYSNNGMPGLGHQRSSLGGRISPMTSPSRTFFELSSALSIEYGFQPLVYSLEPVFRIFDVKTVIQLVALILCEYRILIHSTQMSLLCPVAEGLCTLIYPFRWQHPYVPILPRVLSEYLQAPLPYILGVHSSWLPGLLESGKPEHLVLVDLDRGAVQMQEGGPILPLKFTRGLYKRVKRIIQPEMQEGGDFYQRPQSEVLKRKQNKRRRNRSWTDPSSNSPDRGEPRVRSFHSVSTGTINEVIQEVDAEKDKGSSDGTTVAAADRRTASSSSIYWKDDSEQRTSSNPNLMVKSRSSENVLSTNDNNESECEEEDNLVDSLELLGAWDEEKQRKVRLEFVCFFSAMLVGYRDCLFFVNQKLPVFNKRRFFATCADAEVTPFLTRLFCSQSFQAFLENHGASDLHVFHTVYSTFARYKDLEWPENMPYMALQGGGIGGGNLRSNLYNTSFSNVRTPQAQIQSVNVPTPILRISLDNGMKKLKRRNTMLKRKNSINPNSSTPVTTGTSAIICTRIDQPTGPGDVAAMAGPTGESQASGEPMTTNVESINGELTSQANADIAKEQNPPSAEGTEPSVSDKVEDIMSAITDDLFEKLAIPVSEINESSALPSKVEQAELNDQAIEEEQQEESLESLGRRFEDLLDLIGPTEIPLLKMNQASSLTTTNLSKYDDYRMVAREMGLDEHVFEENWDILEKPHTLDVFSPTAASASAANHNANRNLTNEEEKIEQILHKCLSGIFTSDDSITPDELWKCEMRFKSQYARDLFVLILMQPTHHYADSRGGSGSASAWYNPKGSGSCIGESGFMNLVRLSNSLMDQCALHEDFTNARGMLQVAMQYYRMTEEVSNGVSLGFEKKEYLQNSLRSRPICHSLDMWQHAFSRDIDAAIIADPATACDDNNPNNVSDETFFSLIGSLVYDMLTVEVPVGKVHTFVSVMCSTYQKGKDMFDTLKQLVDNVYRALELSKDQPTAKNRSNRAINSIDGIGNGGPPAHKRQTSVMSTAGSTGGDTPKSRHYDLDNVIRRKMSVSERNRSPSSKTSSASTADKEEHVSSPTTTTSGLGFNLRTRKKAQSTVSSQCVMLCNQNSPILSMVTLQNRVVCGSSDPSISVFDTNHPEKKSKLEGHTGPVVAVQLRGNTLISGSRDHTLRVWDMRIAARKRTIMSYVGFSPSNPMATLNDDIIDIDPAMVSKKSLVLKGHTAPVTCVEIGRQLTTDRALVASGSEDASIRLWDTTRESSISQLGNGKGSVSCLQFIPLRDLLVSGCRKNTVKIWDLASSKMRSNITIHKGAIRDIQITGDRLITASNDRTVKVWDANFRSGQSYTHSLRDHGGPVLCASLGGPADPNICTGSTDGIVRVWDLRYVRKGPRLTLKGHLGPVSCLQRDFTKLVSAGEDGSLKVWDMHSGLCLKDIKGHLSGVTCISYRDASIYSASWDGSVRVWDIEGGPPVEPTSSIGFSNKSPNVLSPTSTTSTFRNWINPFH